MRAIAILCILLIALPAWAGTWLDNFDDGDFDGWQMVECLWILEVVTPNAGNWVVENGAVVAGDNDSTKRYDLYIGDMWWADYIAEVSVKVSKKLETCNEDTGIYLGARCQVDEGKLGLNGYVVGVWNIDGVRRGGFKYSNGDSSNRQTRVLPLKADTWYRLKIEVDGDQITAFVDDLQVFVLRDSSFTSGLVSISVNGVVATFDDFIVTGPDIPNGGPGHSVESSGMLATTWSAVKSH